MKNKNWKKFLIIVVIFLAFIITSIIQIVEFIKGNVTLFILLTSITSSILFVSQVIYNNIYLVFLYINRIKLFVINPTVNWQLNLNIDLKEKIDFNQINKDFYDLLISENLDVKRLLLNDCDFKFTLNSANIDVSYDSECKKISMKYVSRISYRASKNEFDKIVDQIFDLYIENTSPIKKKLYSLTVNFEHLNPFYKLNIKHLEENNVEDFILEANIQGLDVNVSKNRIKILSRDKDLIRKASKSYIAL